MTVDFEPSAEQRTLDAEASALMKQGIALMETFTPEAAAEALTCFDQALALRQQLPIDRAEAFAYGLAACWLNRADALVRLGDEERSVLAVAAFDEALRLLQKLTLDADTNYPRRLAIAWQNRGLLLSARFPARAIEAIENLQSSIALLEDDRAAGIEDRGHLLGAAWVNLAGAYRATGRRDALPMADESARHALSIVAELERRDPHGAEIGLKARHLYCQVLAERLSVESPAADDVHAATDTVEDALDLVRAWEAQGVTAFRAIAADLFRFGALVYQRCQPQFLEEFLEEYGVRVETPGAEPEAPSPPS